MINNKIFKNPYFIATIGIAIVLFMLFLLSTVLRYEKNIEKNMFKIATSDLFEITHNKAKLVKSILGQSDSYIEDIILDKKLRLDLEKNIKTLITSNIEYSYIVYKDKKNVFRFLVDGSPEHEKSMLNQKFDVTTNKWYDIYKSKKPAVVKHQILQKLYISYLVPILNDDKVELILAIDFSVKKISDINKILQMMKMGIVTIISIMVIFLAILIFQLIKYKNIKKSSFVDKLTNLHNRNYLNEIEHKINLDQYMLCVFDIDHFKNVNDKYGHEVGDKVLNELGEIILKTLRANDDIAIRYGGEEFIILLKINPNNTKEPISVVDRIFNKLKEKKIYIDDNEYISITVSIGINTNPGKSKSFMQAFNIADKALYEAKNSGRDTIIIA